MRKQNRILALMLALLIFTFSLAGCSQNEKVIGTCGTYEILYEELRFITLTYKDRLDATYGDKNDENGTIWDDPVTAEKYRKELEDAVWAMLHENYKTLIACEGYLLDREDLESDVIQQAVEEQIQATVAEYGSKSAFQKDLAASHMTENLFRFYLATEELKYELYYVLTRDLKIVENNESDFYDWLQDGNCVYAQHIFIKNDEGDSVEENRAKAQRVRDDIITGKKTFAEYINSATNEDLTNVAPHYIVRDVNVDELADVALEMLSVGDVSEIAELEEGFYIFVRVADTPDMLLSQLPTLFNTYQWVKVADVVNTFEDKVNIELNEFGSSIDLLKIQ